MCPEKINLFKNISLLSRTVAQRVEGTGSNVSSSMPGPNAQSIHIYPLEPLNGILFGKGVCRYHSVKDVETTSSWLMRHTEERHTETREDEEEEEAETSVI